MEFVLKVFEWKGFWVASTEDDDGQANYNFNTVG